MDREFQTKTYSAAIKGIDHIVNIEPEWIFRIQRTDSLDESLSEVSVYNIRQSLCSFALARVFLGTA